MAQLILLFSWEMVKHLTVFIFHYLAAMGAMAQVVCSWLVSLWFPIEIVAHVTNVADEGLEEIPKVESFARDYT